MGWLLFLWTLHKALGMWRVHRTALCLTPCSQVRKLMRTAKRRRRIELIHSIWVIERCLLIGMRRIVSRHLRLWCPFVEGKICVCECRIESGGQELKVRGLGEIEGVYRVQKFTENGMSSRFTGLQKMKNTKAETNLCLFARSDVEDPYN